MLFIVFERCLGRLNHEFLEVGPCGGWVESV